MNRQEVRIWLLENCFGKSGNKINPNTGREQYWQKDNIRKEVYETISKERMSYPVLLRIHLYLSDMTEYTCIKCGAKIKSNRLFCNSTCQMTHFTAVPFKNAQNPEVKARRNKTCIEKYGVDNPWKSTIVQDKIKNILVEKYGVDNPMKCEKNKKYCER